MAKPVTPKDALLRLADLCVSAERCESELRKKLDQWGISPADSRKILDYLREHRYLDEERFAAAYVRDKLNFSRWGPRKIRQGLYLKRINADIIADAIGNVPAAEYESALMHILEGKVKTNQSLIETYEGRTKLYRFAVQRGFDLPMITAAIKALMGRTM